MNVRVTFKNNNYEWFEVHNLFSLMLFSTAAISKVVNIELGTGLQDCNGVELFEGDTYTFYTSLKKNDEGKYVPDVSTYNLNSISDLYGNPFRAGDNCTIVGRIDK